MLPNALLLVQFEAGQLTGEALWTLAGGDDTVAAIADPIRAHGPDRKAAELKLIFL